MPQPNTEQLSPGMTIVDQLTANLAAKTRIFDSNFDFYDSRRHLDFTVVHFRDHVTELKPKQRDHPLKFAGFHNHSPLLTMIKQANQRTKCNMKLEVYLRTKRCECMRLVENKPWIYMEITDNLKECLTFSLMYELR